MFLDHAQRADRHVVVAAIDRGRRFAQRQQLQHAAECLFLAPVGFEHEVRIDAEAAAEHRLAIALEAHAPGMTLDVAGEHGDACMTDVEQMANGAETRRAVLNKDAVLRYG